MSGSSWSGPGVLADDAMVDNSPARPLALSAWFRVRFWSAAGDDELESFGDAMHDRTSFCLPSNGKLRPDRHVDTTGVTAKILSRCNECFESNVDLSPAAHFHIGLNGGRTARDGLWCTLPLSRTRRSSSQLNNISNHNISRSKYPVIG